MATATVEEVQLLKTLRWWDGFVIALCNPGFLLGSLGFTLAAFSVGGAMLLWRTFSRARRPPGLDLFGAGDDVWAPQRRPSRFTPTKAGAATRPSSAPWRPSATGSAGRWFCRSSARSSATWRRRSGGRNSHLAVGFLGNTLSLSSFIAIGCIVFVWGFNVFGLRPAVWFTYACAALLMVPLALFIIVPYFTGDWHSSNVHFDVRFRPVGRDQGDPRLHVHPLPGRRTARRPAPRSRLSTSIATTLTKRCAARRRSSCCSSASCSRSVSAASTGVAGRTTGAEGQFYTQAMGTLVGHGAASFFTICIIASLLAVDDLVDI